MITLSLLACGLPGAVEPALPFGGAVSFDDAQDLAIQDSAVLYSAGDLDGVPGQELVLTVDGALHLFGWHGGLARLLPDADLDARLAPLAQDALGTAPGDLDVYGAELADLDGDGFADLVVSLRPSASPGTPVIAALHGPALDSGQVLRRAGDHWEPTRTIADLDGDGAVELLHFDGPVQDIQWSGGARQRFQTEHSQIHPAVGASDVDGDGFAELVVVHNQGYGFTGETVYSGEPAALDTLGYQESGYAGRVGIGPHDVLVSTDEGLSRLTGPGTWEAEVAVDASHPRAVFGDFNGDRRLDALVETADRSDLYTGRAQGLRVQDGAMPAVGERHELAADVDGDGRDDLVQIVGWSEPSIRVWRSE